MATRRYMATAQSRPDEITEAVGAAVASKHIEVTVDWDALLAAGLEKNQARLKVIQQLQQIAEYIEKRGKRNVVA